MLPRLLIMANQVSREMQDEIAYGFCKTRPDNENIGGEDTDYFEEREDRLILTEQLKSGL